MSEPTNTLYYGEPDPAAPGPLSPAQCCADGPAPADAAEEQARGSLRRLAVALGLAIVLAFLCWVLAPRWGVNLPMIVPLMGFAAIALGTIMAAVEAQPKRAARQDGESPGRPMCCAGPRPVGERLRIARDEA